MKQLILILMSFFIIHEVVLGESVEQYPGNKSNNQKQEWLIKDELSRIEKELGYDKGRNALKQMDNSTIQAELDRIEKALGYDQRNKPYEPPILLKQMDESLIFLELDKLSEIEQKFGYEGWLRLCAKSPACVEIEGRQEDVRQKVINKTKGAHSIEKGNSAR